MNGYKWCSRCETDIPARNFARHVRTHAKGRLGRKIDLDPARRKVLNVNVKKPETIQKFLALHGDLVNDTIVETITDIINEAYTNHFPGGDA